MANMDDQFLQSIYNRNKEIIIGLTGRTGSGCTDVSAKIISLFTGDLPEGKEERHADLDELKYKIALKYFEHWRDGYNILKIEVTDIICWFILQEDKYDLIKYIDKIQSVNNPEKKITEYEKSIYKEVRKELKKGGLLNEVGCNKITINFYKEKAPEKVLENLIKIKKSLKDILNKYSILVLNEKKKKEKIRRTVNLYTYLFQNFGDNIRATGSPYCFQNANKLISDLQTIDSIPQIIDSFINNFKQQKDKSIIIIDALRNPHEVFYFRDKYPNFYLFNISKSNKERQNALLTKGFGIEEIEALEEREFAKLKQDNYFRLNIQKCIELADIHIFNPSDIDNNKTILKKNLIRYLSLIMHPGLVTPTDAERCMKLANDLKVNSGCLSLQVGAVVTDEKYSVVSTGWNTVPFGQVPCNLRDVHGLIKDQGSSYIFSNYELDNAEFNNYIKLQYYLYMLSRQSENDDGILYFCFKDAYNYFSKEKNQVHTRAVHAEEMAFLNNPEKVRNGKLFTTSKPCELCAKKAYELGIREIYYINQYSGISEEHIINCGRKKTKPNLKIFDGITGLAYDRLFTRVVAFDVEQTAITGFSFKDPKEWVNVGLQVNGFPVYLEKVKEQKKIHYFLKADNKDKKPQSFLIDIDNKMLVIKERKGNYVCSDCEQKDKLNCNRDKIQTWEKFKIRFRKDSNEFELQSLANNKFVICDSDGYLKAKAEGFNEENKNMIFTFKYLKGRKKKRVKTNIYNK